MLSRPQDGLAALDAILDARSKAEKERAARENPELLEDLPAKLNSMRSMPPTLRTLQTSKGATTCAEPSRVQVFHSHPPCVE